MKKTFDIHVKEFKSLISPTEMKQALPLTDAAFHTVVSGRKEVVDIMTGSDERLLVIAGPCSIHDPEAALEYAQKLMALRREVREKINLIMRVYFEKPRTTVGWKGLINDPFLDASFNVNAGMETARRLLIDINDLGLPTATEILDPITPQYIAGLLAWVAVGARTTESQTHREMASGLSMPVGFKNCTDGRITAAVNAIQASGSPQHFLGIDPNGRSAVVSTTGNPYCHLVLRGGSPRTMTRSRWEGPRPFSDKNTCLTGSSSTAPMTIPAKSTRARLLYLKVCLASALKAIQVSRD